MRVKRIPAPTLVGDEEKRALHRIVGDVLVIGWEIGHLVFDDPEKEHPEGDPPNMWEKLREAMTLTPEQEAEWEREQAAKPPTVTEETLETADAALVNSELALALIELM